MENSLNEDENYTRGLSELVVDKTSVSCIDGDNGRLFYRGINIQELATHSTFEETAYLLLCEKLPSKSQLIDFSWFLRSRSCTHEKVLRIIKELPINSKPLHTLQMGLAAFAGFEKNDEFSDENSELEKAISIVAQSPIILAASYRNSIGAPILEPRSDISYAENFFYMLFGKIPSKMQTRCLEIALIIQMDHGFNSSTFTARIVASTLASFFCATSAAVGALSGPLHGGASEMVMEFLENTRSVHNVASYVRDLLDSGEKIPGMGHRIYKTVDPRAIIFQDLLNQLTLKTEKNGDLEILAQIENEATLYFKEKMKPVYVNVDFWSGAVYKKLGIRSSLYPAIFAASRMVGWCAHILELRKDNILYRPQAHYIGSKNLPYIPIEERE